GKGGLGGEAGNAGTAIVLKGKIPQTISYTKEEEKGLDGKPGSVGHGGKSGDSIEVHFYLHGGIYPRACEFIEVKKYANNGEVLNPKNLLPPEKEKNDNSFEKAVNKAQEEFKKILL